MKSKASSHAAKEEIFYRNYSFFVNDGLERKNVLNYLGQIKRFRKSSTGIGTVFYDEFIEPYVFTGYCIWLVLMKKRGIDGLTQIFTLVNQKRMDEYRLYYDATTRRASDTIEEVSKITTGDFLSFVSSLSMLDDSVIIADAIVSKFGDDGMKYVNDTMDINRLQMLASMNSIYKDTFFNK